MKKIIITLACLLALCISSCVTFAAEDEFTVYVGGEEMTVSKDGTAATYNSPSGGEAKLWYDAEAGLKLEITDLKLDNEGIRTDHQMTLVIKGENSFDVGGSSPKLYGVYAKGGIVVSDESGGSLSVTVGDASMTSFGIYSAGDIVINGGELDVRTGKTDNQESIGIYAGKMVKINGGVVKAYGGNAVKDISSGIGAYDGIEILGGEVAAVGGPGSYSIGLYCYWDMKIGGNAAVEARSSNGDVKVYSYGTFVYGDLLVADSADFTSVAGATNDEPLSNKEKRSCGIFLGDDVTGDVGEASDKNDVFKVTGGVFTAESLDDDGCDVMLYDAVFVDERQVSNAGVKDEAVSAEDGSPDTGDGMNLFVLIGLAFITMVAGVVTGRKIN